MLNGIFTDATCGDACWHAREDICRCSCGGRNHGILRSAKGTRPARTRRIRTDRYELAAVVFVTGPGTAYIDTERAVEDWIAENDPTAARHRTDIDGNPRRYVKVPTSPGGRYYVHLAAVQQVNKWEELEPYREKSKGWKRPQLIWRRINPEDEPAPEPAPTGGSHPEPRSPAGVLQTTLFDL